MPLEIALGDRVKLRKQHPCGGTEWTVTRLGADIGLKCDTCGRYILIPRRDLEKRLKTKIAGGVMRDK
ncbi:MAG: DUF951 domain-containing protein [Chloroflexi bacterium]|nr:DUF951 domain-containing protein [Chloroflexota bacterium]